MGVARRTVEPVLHAVATWWDGVELWLTQLDFPVQVVLVVAVLGPLCWGVAAVIDTVVERSVAARLGASERRVAANRAPSGQASAGPVD